jgi:putative ABC transport system permease protein
MNHILLLTKSYFHKTKGQTASLIILILITTMLLNIGLIVLFGMNTFFNDRAEDLNAGHFATIVDPRLDVNEVEQFLIDHETVINVERSEVLYTIGEILVDDHVDSTHLILGISDPTIEMNPLMLIGDYLPLEGDVIYIPHALLSNSGYEIGDRICLSFPARDIWFTIGGSTEVILFGGERGTKFYISDEKFYELQAEFPEILHTMLTVRGENHEDGTTIFSNIANENFTPIEEITDNIILFSTTYESVRNRRMMIPSILSIFIVAMAALLLIINSIVVRFRINSHVEESVRNMGILKAIGYKNKQIIYSVMLQFKIITLVGGILGIMTTSVVMPLVVKELGDSLGLVWQSSVDYFLATKLLLMLIGVNLLITYLSARRINRLYPLSALRDGKINYKFKKNYFPLEQSKRSLTLLLSFKEMFQNKKQMFSMFVITIGLTITGVTALTIYYNTVVDNEILVRTVEGAVADIGLLYAGADGIEMSERIANMTEVENIYGFDPNRISATMNEVNIVVKVTEDTSYLGTHMLINGRYPTNANEIAISPVVANHGEFAIGESVMINYGGQEEEFLITGIVQALTNAGLFGLLTGEGFRRLEPNYTFDYFLVNLVEGIDVTNFADFLVAQEGNIFDTIIIFRSLFEAASHDLSAIFTPVTIGIIIISSLVIVVVQYIVIRMMITQRHKELGIQKALGFTNIQLMNQIILNLLPVIVISTLIGGVLGYFSFNPIFVTLMSGAGIGAANLPIPISWIFVFAIGMGIFSYIVAMWMARRIRKIFPYELVSE